MSTKVKNSLSTFLDQALILTQNNMETLSKINDAVTSNEDSITLTLTNPKNPEDVLVYNIPSFGFLKNAIERLEATLSTMSNINGASGSRIRLSDGSYRKIITSKVPSEAPTITNVNSITNFSFKSNWFFEDMLNPMLYITWDFSNQIPYDTERVMIQRYILDCDTPKKKSVFEKQLKGRNDIDYKDFLYILVNNKIRYTLDDEIKDLPPRSKRYTGNFSVIRGEVESNSDGTGSSMRYSLVSLNYTDNRADFENTRVLSVGDVVEVNSNPVTTRYKVTYVDVSANKIGLKCIEGLEPVRVGVNTLRISASQDGYVQADIPIGFDERQVIFVKSIDPDSNMPSANWSKGVGFYSNELTYKDANGDMKTLQSFYQKNVIDFGQVLLSYGDDYYPTIREGIVPNPPSLKYSNGEGDFKIVQINSQLTEGTDSQAFRQLVSTKAAILASMDTNLKNIEKQKTIIQTTNFINPTEKVNAQDKLNSLFEEQERLSSEYTSTVNTIKSKYIDGPTVAPKYRVRGFWDMPDEKVSPSSGPQKIIKFKIRYRYLSKSGAANKEEEFSYTSNGVQVTGRFSNWNEIETKLRPRVKFNGSWTWEHIDTANPDVVNINQLDIPIQPGEQVEIQVKSVCEAGFPANPMESVWSEPIVIAFSDFAELESDDVTELIEQNKVDASIASVTSSFKPMNSHVSSSFYANDKYFAHSAQNITSGFLSPEQTPITLFDKLQDLQSQISQIIEQINHTVGELKVTLCTSETDGTKQYTLNENGVTYINAGSYTTEVNRRTNTSNRRTHKNGTIVTKTFYLDITTDVQSGLYLLSKLSGNRNCMVPSTLKTNTSINDETGTLNGDMNFYDIYDNVLNPSTTSSTYYMTKGRYDLVPINLTGANNDIDFTTVCPNGYQSAQCRGQFVYSRFRDVSDTFDMYANDKSRTSSPMTDANGNISFSSTRTTDENYGIFKENAKFSTSEIYVGKNTDLTISDSAKMALYGTSDEATTKRAEFDTYCALTQTDGVDFNSLTDDSLSKITPILYRLPMTFKKRATTLTSLVGNKNTVKIIKRIEKNVSGTPILSSETKSFDVTKQKEMTDKLTARMSASTNLKTTNGPMLRIEPKIQSAYGLSDWGKICEIDLDGVNGTNDDGSYITTHKIGYTESDKYLSGEGSCSSYLYLSPVNHESIQVEGDTVHSAAVIDSNSSIKVPIVYQYRMTDYNGNIFGVKGLKSTDSRVKDTKFANIIGIDIWTDTSSEEPKQYDIVVYSSFGDSSIIDAANIQNNGTQNLVDVSKNVATNLANLVQQSVSTSKIEVGAKEIAKRTPQTRVVSPIQTIKK